MPNNRNPLSGKNAKGTSTSVGVGIAVGAIVGVLTDNPGLWIAIGLAVGSAVGAARTRLR